MVWTPHSMTLQNYEEVYSTKDSDKLIQYKSIQGTSIRVSE